MGYNGRPSPIPIRIRHVPASAQDDKLVSSFKSTVDSPVFGTKQQWEAFGTELSEWPTSFSEQSPVYPQTGGWGTAEGSVVMSKHFPPSPTCHTTTPSLTNPGDHEIINHPYHHLNRQGPCASHGDLGNPSSVADMDTLAFVATQEAPYANARSFPHPTNPHAKAPMAKFGEYPPMDILSAEQYNDNAYAIRGAGRGGNQQKQETLAFGLSGRFEFHESPHEETSQSKSSRKASVDAPGQERRRKKQKTRDDEDESSKKVRGRPRVDTTDETPADRRRTQIRMAQRAYRHRKETTIASLEKQVQDLRGTNEEMNSIFVALYDFAVARGVLQREPEFGQHLASSTARFAALARSIEDGQSSSPAATSTNDDKTTNAQSGATVPAPIHQERFQISAMDTPVESTWGYQVDKNDNFDDLPELQYDKQPLYPEDGFGHQIVAQATEDNASFPFDFDFPTTVQTFRAEIPDMTEAYRHLADLQQSLPLPRSLAHQEISFGRRLQRSAIERGFRLISAKDPNPTRYQDVFGFCLRFESRQDIYNRLAAGVRATAKDSLFNWRAPFVHLGDAGTYYPMSEDIAGDMIPKIRTGRSMGPFSPEVMETREIAMWSDFRTKVPGFEGEFFDSNDVEGYLRRHGIEIPVNADFITVDLEQMPNYDHTKAMANSDSGSSSKVLSPKTPENLEGRLGELRAMEDYFPADASEIVSTSTSNLPEDLSGEEWAIATVKPPEASKIADDFFDLAGPIFNAGLAPPVAGIPRDTGRRSRTVTISVSILVEELISRALCLGRAPGFRPADVDSAIRRTLQASF